MPVDTEPVYNGAVRAFNPFILLPLSRAPVVYAAVGCLMGTVFEGDCVGWEDLAGCASTTEPMPKSKEAIAGKTALIMWDSICTWNGMGKMRKNRNSGMKKKLGSLPIIASSNMQWKLRTLIRKTAASCMRALFYTHILWIDGRPNNLVNEEE